MALLLSVALLAPAADQVFTGVITDTMCGTDHQSMKISPDDKCIRDCAKAGSGVKFALQDGKNIYKLSDQATPAQFAGRKVRVSGTLFPKTGIIDVKRIEPVK